MATTKAKARLTDIEVDEVSLVDRAANKRTFLLVKNADGETVAGPGLTPGASVEEPVESQPAAAEPVAEGTAPAVAAEAVKVEGDAVAAVAPSGDASPAVETPASPEAAAVVVADAADAGAPVSKRGAKMAKERLTRFRSAIDQLSSVLAELEDVAEGGDVAEPADDEPALVEDEDKAACKPKKVEKSAEQIAAEEKAEALEAELAELKKISAQQAVELKAAAITLKKQAAILAEARLATVANSVEPEGLPAPKVTPFRWGSDLNEERRRSRT